MCCGISVGTAYCQGCSLISVHRHSVGRNPHHDQDEFWTFLSKHWILAVSLKYFIQRKLAKTLSLCWWHNLWYLSETVSRIVLFDLRLIFSLLHRTHVPWYFGVRATVHEPKETCHIWTSCNIEVLNILCQVRSSPETSSVLFWLCVLFDCKRYIVLLSPYLNLLIALNRQTNERSSTILV